MMQVCYDDEGKLLFTVDGEKVPPGLDGNWVAMPKQDLGDFSSWRIVDEQLILWDVGPTTRAFHDAVNLKRARLITAGVVVEVTGHGPVALQGRPEDQSSLQGLAFGAQLRLSVGDNATPMAFLDRENVLHLLVPMQMLELWQKGAEFISETYARSWQIKAMDPFTTDIENAALWEVST